MVLRTVIVYRATLLLSSSSPGLNGSNEFAATIFTRLEMMPEGSR